MKALAVLLALCLSAAFAAEEASQGRHRHKPFFHHNHKAPAAPPPAETAAVDIGEDSTPVVVPSEPSAGKDGFPALPQVAQMLGGASKTMESINSQAAVLEARVVQAQHDNEVRMSQQKSVYEKKLKEQEKESRVVIGENDKVSNEISSLKAENTKLKKHAKDLQDGNKLRRTELKTLESKLGAAKDFATAALKSTDDSKAKELVVLDTTHAVAQKAQKVRKLGFGKKAQAEEKHEDADTDSDKDDSSDDDKDDASDDDKGKDDDDSDDDDSDKGTALVETESHHIGKGHKAEVVDEKKSTDARDLLQVLSKGVDDMTVEAKSSESKLQTMFVEAFKSGGKRHAALVEQRTSLQTQRSELKALQAQLRTAIAHLQATREQLDQRLKGMGSFIQRLGHLAMAPSGEVARIMKGLPTAVSLAQTSSRVH